MVEYRKEGNFEKPATTMNGIAMLFLLIALVLLVIGMVVAVRNPILLAANGVAIAFVAPGFFMLQPNEAAVLTLFGDYVGTERQPGLRWTLPWNGPSRSSTSGRNSAKMVCKNCWSSPISTANYTLHRNSSRCPFKFLHEAV